MAPGILPLLLRDVELNISFYMELTYAGHPQFPRFRALGALEFFLKAQPFASVQCTCATDSGIQDSK